MSGEKGQALATGAERFCVSFVRTALLLRQGTVCGMLIALCQGQPVSKQEMLAAGDVGCD